MIGEEKRRSWELEHQASFRQLSLFDDMKLSAEPSRDDVKKAAFGEI